MIHDISAKNFKNFFKWIKIQLQISKMGVFSANKKRKFFKPLKVLSLARSVPKPLKVPSLARSVPKPLKVPSLARSVHKPLKVPSLARSVLKPLKEPSFARSVPKPLSSRLCVVSIGRLPYFC